VVYPFAVIGHLPITVYTLVTAIPILFATWYTLLVSTKRTVCARVISVLLWPLLWVLYIIAACLSPIALGFLASWNLHETGCKGCFRKVHRRNQEFWKYVRYDVYKKLEDELHTGDSLPVKKAPVVEMKAMDHSSQNEASLNSGKQSNSAVDVSTSSSSAIP
jgi:hypothetical protein